MLLLKLTKTVNIDIFNYWIFLIMGSVVYAGTGNYWAFGRYYIRYFCVDAIGGRFNGAVFTKKL
ncbi:PTS system protein [Klebsiella pneumoniae]|uniref:PTS system protein n=1 Tax=Klebsiella pneumoniae TaxID=573 RepID=A0A447S0L0_KLEPN|nr:PTS system protein [Klebsiella pneumoniae]